MIENNPSKSDINKRFALVFLKLEREGIIGKRDRSEVARKLGLDPSRLTEILKGRRNISADEIAKFAMIYDVNPLYILYEIMPILMSISEIKDLLSQKGNLMGNLMGNLIPEPVTNTLLAAEAATAYQRAAKITIQATRLSEDGKVEYIAVSIGELAKIMGLEEIKELLNQLISQQAVSKR